MLQGQTFEVEVTHGKFFECRFELFKVIVLDYRKAYKWSSVSKRDQGFFLSGQMLDFLHRLLRQIVQRGSFRNEKDWEALRDVHFS